MGKKIITLGNAEIENRTFAVVKADNQTSRYFIGYLDDEN